MSNIQFILTIAVCAAATMLTRFLPFLVFGSRGGKVPEVVEYLGHVLPAAIFGMLIVYCLKGVSLTSGSHGIPEAIAIGVTIALRKILTKKQLWVAGCLGAVAHSIGQMAMAVALTGTVSLAVYLPVMIAVSILTGLFTGLCAQFLVNREKLWKIISK